MCITQRGIETYNNDERWIEEQTPNIKNLGFNCTGICIIYSKDLDEIDSSLLLQIYKSLQMKSIDDINSNLQTHITHKFFNPIDDDSWFSIFKKMWNTFVKFINFENLMVTVKDAFKELLIKLGFSETEAEKISKETY